MQIRHPHKRNAQHKRVVLVKQGEDLAVGLRADLAEGEGELGEQLGEGDGLLEGGGLAGRAGLGQVAQGLGEVLL
jgi:hypothetical protein